MKYLRTNTYLGYIEGYYGNLLNWRDRNSIILALKKNNMNAYFYAPKEDLNHRFDWRRKYSKIWLNKFSHFCSNAKKNKIKIIVGVSPGADFNFLEIYQKEKLISYDLNILLDKCKMLIHYGADEIALLFDDIPNVFNNSSKFKNYNEGKSHGKLVALLSQKLNREIFVVPRIYADELISQNSTYIDDLIIELNGNSNLFYCGKFIVNQKFETNQKKIEYLYYKNKVIYWDNFYANDYCPNKIFLGPYPLNDTKKSVMFNLTGLINTDKLLIQIIKNCLKNKNKITEWEKTILENQIPNSLIKIISFFESPIFSFEKKICKVSIPNNIFEHLDFLLWKWKSPLSREWYNYLLMLKQDLEILSDNFNKNRIMKIKTYPLQKLLLKRRI